MNDLGEQVLAIDEPRHNFVRCDEVALSPPVPLAFIGFVSAAGRWYFIEAGPGSYTGTEHEAVFKVVARRIRGEQPPVQADTVGGPLS